MLGACELTAHPKLLSELPDPPMNSVARSQTVTVALCIPIMANAYFIRTGHCKLDDPNVPPEKVKEVSDSFYESNQI